MKTFVLYIYLRQCPEDVCRPLSSPAAAEGTGKCQRSRSWSVPYVCRSVPVLLLGRLVPHISLKSCASASMLLAVLDCLRLRVHTSCGLCSTLIRGTGISRCLETRTGCPREFQLPSAHENRSACLVPKHSLLESRRVPDGYLYPSDTQSTST